MNQPIQATNKTLLRQFIFEVIKFVQTVAQLSGIFYVPIQVKSHYLPFSKTNSLP